MPFTIVDRPLGEIAIIQPRVHEDDRGFFMENFRADQFRDLGLPDHFVQGNHSRSARRVLRGLHFQWSPPMGKLMRVTQGSAFLVAVDIRPDSPTLGQWHGCEISAANRLLFWAPAHFARGFCALADSTEVQYLCTGTYNGEAEGGVLWSDPAIGIRWPISDPILSGKDREAPTLAEWLQRPAANAFAARTHVDGASR